MRHPDEGTIHAWLDGALPPDEARAVEAHAAGCAECAARVADARGMIAGASRILSALDAAPAGVVPKRSGARPAPPRAAWWRRPGIGAAAAIAIVAVGTTWAVTRNWGATPASTMESTAPMILAPADSTAMRAAVDSVAPMSADISISEAAAPAAPPPAPSPTMPARQPGDAATNLQREVQPTAGAAPAEAPPPGRVGNIAATPLTMLEDRMRTAAADSTTDAVSKAADQRATRQRRMMLGAPSDSLQVVPAPRPPVAARERAEAEAAPIVSGRGLGMTARDLAGCYALELGQATTGSAPALPGVVRLAESAEQAALGHLAPQAAQGFRLAPQPLLVPPAMDSGQLGWSVASVDSVAVRLATEGRTVLLTFPTTADAPRSGFASAGELPGVPSWRAPVIVQRVPCPAR